MPTEDNVSNLGESATEHIHPAANLSDLRSAPMVWPVRPTSDFDRIASNVALWHDYDPRVKADLYSTCLVTSGGAISYRPNSFTERYAWHAHRRLPCCGSHCDEFQSLPRYLLSLPSSARLRSSRGVRHFRIRPRSNLEVLPMVMRFVMDYT